MNSEGKENCNRFTAVTKIKLCKYFSAVCTCKFDLKVAAVLILNISCCTKSELCDACLSSLGFRNCTSYWIYYLIDVHAFRKQPFSLVNREGHIDEMWIWASKNKIRHKSRFSNSSMTTFYSSLFWNGRKKQ